MSVSITCDGAAAQSPADQSPADHPRFLTTPLGFIGHYVARQRWLFLALAGVVVGASSCAVGVQYGMKLLIDVMTASGPSHARVSTGLGLFIGLIAAESLLWRLCGWMVARSTTRAGVEIRVELFSHLTGHSMNYFDEHLAGSLGHRITSTAGAFGAIANRLVWEVAPTCVNFVGALILFAALDRGVAVMLAASVLASTGVLTLVGLRGRPHHRAYARSASAAVGELMDVIGNIWAVKSFSARRRESDRLAGVFSAEADVQRRSAVYSEKVRLLNDACLLAIAAATLLWSVHLWGRGRISPGDVVLVSALTFRLLHGSRDVAMGLIDMGQQLTYIGETLRLVGKPHGVPDRAPTTAALVPSAPRQGVAIAFETVSFGYAAERPVLRNLCFAMTPGERVGLVGASGAGKSTITHLVQRFYDVQTGRVLVDGQSVSSLAQDRLRETIATVPQTVSLFHRSVMDNIRFARPDAGDEAVFAAARAACCHDFIYDLAQGYDTVLGDRGATLSGGQRQRIGIARAFLKDAPILILDEATSALDVQSEAAVQLALKRLMRGRTVLAIAHRLSTLADMDRILVLSEGEIVEDGSIAELRARGGLFDHLWRLQMGDAAVLQDGRGGRARLHLA